MRFQLHQQLKEMFEAGKGRSKHADKQAGETAGRIYTDSTFYTYKRQCGYFVTWLEKHHPEVHTIRKAKKYVKEYLEAREATGQYSAYTMQLSAKALGKLYNIQPQDKEYWTPPVRHRADIKRSRTQTEYDKHFSVTNNDSLIRFRSAPCGSCLSYP